MQEKQSYILPAVLVFFIAILMLDFLQAVSVGVVAFLFLKFIIGMKHYIPFVSLILLIIALQWLLGPVLHYNFLEEDEGRYTMYVPAEEYFNLLLPAFFALIGGLSFFNERRLSIDGLQEQIQALIARFPNLPYYLLIIGIGADLLGQFVPPALRFVVFLASGLKYIAAIYLFVGQHPKRWQIVAVLVLFTAVSSISAGLFHDLLLWSVLLFIYIAYVEKLSLGTKVLIIIIGLFSAFAIQLAKSEFRQLIWAQGVSSNQTTLFFDVVSSQLSAEEVSDSQSGNLIVRLNQGWIISRVMYFVPEFADYADGETIEEAIYASLLPRFLNPNKKQAGGQENFEKFTGLYLSSSTSMGVSLIGEAYANYGYEGTILFMFVWGLFLAMFLRFLTKKFQQYPTLILWLPLIFLQVVKAETELVVVLNHLVKASIFVFGVFWISRNVFKVQL